MRRSIRSFNIPSPGNPWTFDCSPCPVGGDFEPCQAGVRNLNRKCQVFPVRIQWFSSWISRCLRSLSRRRSFVADFAFYKKIYRQLRQIRWEIWTQLTNQSSEVKCPGVCPGKMLKPRIDRPIKLIASPSSVTLRLQFTLDLAHTRKFLCINWKVYMKRIVVRCLFPIDMLQAFSLQKFTA